MDRAFTPELNTAYGVGSVKIPVILGRANDGSSITVLTAFYWNSYDNEIDLLANEIVIGAHFDSARAVVREAVVGYSNLEEWTACQLVQQSAGDDDAAVRFSVAKDLNPNLQVSELPGLKTLSLSTNLEVSHNPVETKLTNQSRFILEFNHPVALQVVTDSVRSLGNLLALLIDEPVQPTNIKLTLQFEPTGPDVFANYAIPPRATLPKKKPDFEMLLPAMTYNRQTRPRLYSTIGFRKDKFYVPCMTCFSALYIAPNSTYRALS
jgi:hypothetical protein